MEATVHKTKFFISMMKEKHYLEEMAQQGYFLKDLTAGVVYTFEVGEPRHMVYDVDRFDLPPSPSLKDVREKETFLEFAKEMGWQEVTHDEDMNYYFSRLYEENGVNELYDTDEGRRQHAEKYRERFIGATGDLLKWMQIGGIVMAIAALISAKQQLAVIGFIYLLFSGIFAKGCLEIGNMVYEEMRMGYEKWQTAYGIRQNTRKWHRFFFTAKGLTKFLQSQSAQGWYLVRSTWISYCFEKGEPREEYYVIDSRSAVNRRQRADHRKKVSDRKDINQINNDWQAISMREAEKEGLIFACAYGNNQIIYRSGRDIEFGQQKGFLHVWMLHWLIFYGICFLIGFVIGFAGTAGML